MEDCKDTFEDRGDDRCKDRRKNRLSLERKTIGESMVGNIQHG